MNGRLCELLHAVAMATRNAIQTGEPCTVYSTPDAMIVRGAGWTTAEPSQATDLMVATVMPNATVILHETATRGRLYT